MILKNLDLFKILFARNRLLRLWGLLLSEKNQKFNYYFRNMFDSGWVLFFLNFIIKISHSFQGMHDFMV